MAERPAKRNVHGILLLDKRIGVSSNRALQEVKRLFNANKAGHTGSLDPLATGLLPLCFGEATKVSGMLLDDHKRYKVTIQLGIKTDTGDLEGNILETRTVPAFTRDQILAALTQFKGQIDQLPPMFSALKHNGKKLYELARLGKTVERQYRRIEIFELHLLAFENDCLMLDVFCSKGTYVRSLAEDIGELLACGATVKSLRRTVAGAFRLEQALTLEQLQTLDNESLLKQLISVDFPLQTLPAVYLTDQQSTAIKFGQSLVIEQPALGSVRMYHADEFLGLGELCMNGKLAPKKLFNLNNTVQN